MSAMNSWSGGKKRFRILSSAAYRRICGEELQLHEGGVPVEIDKAATAVLQRGKGGMIHEEFVFREIPPRGKNHRDFF